MNAAVATAIAFAVYAAGYLFYSRYLARRVFELRDDVATPAHEQRDGVDYVPTRPAVLFGHHYASIAGLAPMLGPAVAVIWGWFPAMAWVVLGALFVGCVHDMGSLVLSIRARGMSIGKVAEGIIGRRAKTLFHIIIFFLVALAMGVFVFVIAFLLSPPTEAAQDSIRYPNAAFPSFGLMLIAAAIGFLGYKKGISWKILTPIGFALLLVLTYLASLDPVIEFLRIADPSIAPGVDGWSMILLGYALVACVLPVWTLLQPRDFLNCLLLYLGLGTLYLGVFVLQPDFVAPAVQLEPEGAPNMFPFVFIIIACGAASGFHSLVASGTTAKQLDNETDARPIGYGGMIGESLLGLIAVLATTAGLLTVGEWNETYAHWSGVQELGVTVALFIDGCTTFLEALGLDRHLGGTFISLIVVSYALTSLDSATRLLRYNVEEISETLGVEILQNRFLSSLIAVGAIGFFAFYEVDGESAGLALWALFGTTNQLMASLALMAITLYLLMRDKPWYVAGIPAIAMFGTTITAMTTNTLGFIDDSSWLLATVGSVLLVLAVWVAVESVLALRRHLKDGTVIEDLAVFPDAENE